MKFSNSTWIRSGIALAAIMACALPPVLAQTDLGSPYSVLGIGLPVKRHTIAQAGMGTAGVALSDPYRLNIMNPAAAAFHAEPIFEAGGIGQISTFRSGDDSFENQIFSLNNLGMAFPIKRGAWNLNLGLVQLTNVSYDFVTTEESEDLGAFRAEYRGDGGISQAYIGTAYKLYAKRDTAGNISALSAGVIFNYNFGPINNTRKAWFPSDPASVGIIARENYLVRDASWEMGLQYQTNVIKRSINNPRYLKLLLGAVYRMGNDLSAERSNYIHNFRPLPGGSELAGDTIFQSTRAPGHIHIPQSLMVGAAFDYFNSNRKRIRLAFDYSRENWSNFQTFFDGQESPGAFNDADRIAVGVEYTPIMGSPNFFKRIEYRLGYRHANTGITVANTDVSEYGMSFGLTLPVNHRMALSQSTFSFAVEYGSFGTTDNGLVAEDFVRIMAGFSFTPHFRNRWFVKPKYD